MADRRFDHLRQNQKRFSVHFYPNVNHGFHNDTTPRYDEEAAELAWERTLAFFEEHLVEHARDWRGEASRGAR